MAGKYVAIDGCELEDVTGKGTVKITSAPSQEVGFCGGSGAFKGFFFGPVAVSVSGSNGGGSIGDNNGAGTGTITGTGTKIQDGSGRPCLLEGDTATVQVSGTTPSGSSSVPVGPILITIRVKKAAQQKITDN